MHWPETVIQVRMRCRKQKSASGAWQWGSGAAWRRLSVLIKLQHQQTAPLDNKVQRQSTFSALCVNCRLCRQSFNEIVTDFLLILWFRLILKLLLTLKNMPLLMTSSICHCLLIIFAVNHAVDVNLEGKYLWLLVSKWQFLDGATMNITDWSGSA